MNRVLIESDIPAWVERLEEVSTDDMGWYTRPFDYRYIEDNLRLALAGDRNIILHGPEGCIWVHVENDPFSPEVVGALEKLLRPDVEIPGASHALRDAACRIAAEEFGATAHYALNVPQVRPGLSAEKEAEIMQEHGYWLFSNCWSRDLPA